MCVGYSLGVLEHFSLRLRERAEKPNFKVLFSVSKLLDLSLYELSRGWEGRISGSS